MQPVIAFIDFPFSPIHKELLASPIVMSSPTTGALTSYDYTHATAFLSKPHASSSLIPHTHHSQSIILPTSSIKKQTRLNWTAH